VTEQQQQQEETEPTPLDQLASKVQGMSRVLSTPARDAGVLTLTLRNWLVPILGETVQALAQVVDAFGVVSYQSGRALVLSERNAAVDVVEQVADLFEELGPHVGESGRSTYAQIQEVLMFFIDEEGGEDLEDDLEEPEEEPGDVEAVAEMSASPVVEAVPAPEEAGADVG